MGAHHAGLALAALARRPIFGARLQPCSTIFSPTMPLSERKSPSEQRRGAPMPSACLQLLGATVSARCNSCPTIRRPVWPERSRDIRSRMPTLRNRSTTSRPIHLASSEMKSSAYRLPARRRKRPCYACGDVGKSPSARHRRRISSSPRSGGSRTASIYRTRSKTNFSA